MDKCITYTLHIILFNFNLEINTRKMVFTVNPREDLAFGLERLKVVFYKLELNISSLQILYASEGQSFFRYGDEKTAFLVFISKLKLKRIIWSV